MLTDPHGCRPHSTRQPGSPTDIYQSVCQSTEAPILETITTYREAGVAGTGTLTEYLSKLTLSTVYLRDSH